MNDAQILKGPQQPLAVKRQTPDQVPSPLRVEGSLGPAIGVVLKNAADPRMIVIRIIQKGATKKNVAGRKRLHSGFKFPTYINPPLGVLAAGRRCADAQGTRWERGHRALVEGLSPTLIGELEALAPQYSRAGSPRSQAAPI